MVIVFFQNHTFLILLKSILKYFTPPYLDQKAKPPFELNPIEWLWKSGLSESQQREKFWGRYFHYKRTDIAAEANVFMVPYFFNGYFDTGRVNLVKKAAQEARALQKSLVIWVQGDYDFRIPIPNAVVIVQGPDIRGGRPIRLAGPVEITDYLPQFTAKQLYLPKTTKPTVGFVGQADSKRLLWYFLRNILWYISFGLRINDRKPPSLVPHVLLRKRALKVIASSNQLLDRFIVRSQFLGVGASKSQHEEYLYNIINHQYTLCIRGTGNFSFRFYDTLSLGRIPILVDTHCVLPFPNEIDWARLIVIVPQKVIHELPTYVLRYHQALSEQEFIERQRELRAVWEKYLKREAYYERLAISLQRLSF